MVFVKLFFLTMSLHVVGYVCDFIRLSSDKVTAEVCRCTIFGF